MRNQITSDWRPILCFRRNFKYFLFESLDFYQHKVDSCRVQIECVWTSCPCSSKITESSLMSCLNLFLFLNDEEIPLRVISWQYECLLLQVFTYQKLFLCQAVQHIPRLLLLPLLYPHTLLERICHGSLTFREYGRESFMAKVISSLFLGNWLVFIFSCMICVS